MATLKSLIVNGVSKFLNDVYLDYVKSGIWNGSTIGVSYGGTGVTASVGSATTPVYLSSSGIASCSSSLSDYLSKSGGTLTGNLYIKSSVADLSYSNNSTADYKSLVFYDKNNYETSRFYSAVTTDGKVASTIRTTNKDTSENTYEAYFSLIVDKNGTVSYSVTNAAAFRTAISAINFADLGLSHSSLYKLIDSVTLVNSSTKTPAYSTWNSFFGETNPTKSWLFSFRNDAVVPSWIAGSYCSGIAFGGLDTKGVLSVSYGTPKLTISAGNGDAPTWYINITGTNATTYNLDNLSGGSNVSQTLDNTSTGNYYLTFKNTNNTTTETTGVKFTDKFYIQPSTGNLTTSGDITLGGIKIVGASNKKFSIKKSAHNNVANSNIDLGWDYSNSDGAGMGLRSSNSGLPSADLGAFLLYAKNTSGIKVLKGLVNGVLTWDSKKIWREDNDGANSGLDADLLDGQEGSYYAAASSLSNYVSKTGDSTINGNITATTFYASSDINLKENILKISDSIYSFNFKSTGEKSYGFIAQYLEKEHPELVSDGDIKTVNYNAALSLVISKLENRIKELENIIKDGRLQNN